MPFTEEALLIMDVALTEFVWGLEDELDNWDAYNGDGFDKSDNEFFEIQAMIEDCEGLLFDIQDYLVGELEVNYNV